MGKTLATILFLGAVYIFDPPSNAALADNRVKSDPQMVCTLSAFASIQTAALTPANATLDGQGLVVCQKDQGFTTELPVAIEITTDIPGGAENMARIKSTTTELSLSANSSPFIVNREIAQLEDTYLVRRVDPVLLRGIRHDLALELKISSRTSDVSGLVFKSVRIRFDNSAPDLD